MQEEIKTPRDLIIDALKDKASTKQKLYRKVLGIFAEMKEVVNDVQLELAKTMSKIDKDVKISVEVKSNFEIHLKFSGDILIFAMHTNIFNFPDDHYVYKTQYVQEDPTRAYCGMIQIYNFLADSLKYNRMRDTGYLIGRLFVNKDRHFFVEGKRQLGFLYNNFETMILDADALKAIVESSILYSINFDLLVPPYENVKELSLEEKIEQLGNSSVKTGKRLGFRFQADSDGM